MLKDNYKEASKYRLKEAQALHDANLYEGSYYIGGYVIESSLKFLYETIKGMRLTGREHSLISMGERVEKVIANEPIIAAFAPDLLNYRTNELVEKWEVSYRYQGKISFLKEQNMEAYMKMVNAVFIYSRQIEKEWNQLKGGPDNDN